MSEDRLQYECVSWYNESFPKMRKCLFHPANELVRDFKQLGVQQSIGYVVGIQDLFFIYKGMAMAIEMKRPDGKGRVREKQDKVHQNFKDNGNPTVVCISLDHFKAIILAFIAHVDSIVKPSFICP